MTPVRTLGLMRLVLAVVTSAVLLLAGCGWSPPGAAPAAPGATWTEVANGHTTDCRLYWVQIAPTSAQPDSPNQVLFFSGNTPLGPATPDPRPYISVLPTGEDTVQVQYQWRQGDEPPCCPTGIGTVRFRIGGDGKLEAVDPIPHG